MGFSEASNRGSPGSRGMPLAPDTQVGPFQITALLGAGGMGEGLPRKRHPLIIWPGGAGIICPVPAGRNSTREWRFARRAFARTSEAIGFLQTKVCE